MNIESSELNVDRIVMVYKNMLESDIVGKEITIQCRGYRNPTVPIVHTGFSLKIYDSEQDLRVISGTREFVEGDFDSAKDLVLDATTYTPAQVPQGFFTVNPSSN